MTLRPLIPFPKEFLLITLELYPKLIKNSHKNIFLVLIFPLMEILRLQQNFIALFTQNRGKHIFEKQKNSLMGISFFSKHTKKSFLLVKT